MFYTAVLIKSFQPSTILFFNVLLLKKKKQNSLVRLEVTTSYFRDTLCDYERKSCRRKQSAIKQTKTDTWVGVSLLEVRKTNTQITEHQD